MTKMKGATAVIGFKDEITSIDCTIAVIKYTKLAALVN